MLSRFRRRLRYVLTTGARRRLRDAVLASGAGDRFVLREDVARRYLAGAGIEIGPLFWPLRVPPGVRVRYVDHLARDELVRANAEYAAVARLDPAAIPPVDIVDDAQRLGKLDDGTEDFVIANHFLEHTEDPIGALQQLLRVLRADGILFLTLPDARRTFDARRARTTVEHLRRDHEEGPLASRREHYEEWARIIDGVPEERVAERVAAFERTGARHHFHVWEPADFLALLRALDLPCELELAQSNGEEFVVILRKR